MEAGALAGVPLFEGLNDVELKRCAEPFEEVVVLTGERVTMHDAYGYRFYVLLDGEVSVIRDGRQLARLGPGDFFGEMALFGPGKRTATVVTGQRSRLAQAMVWDVKAMAEAVPAVGERIRRAISDRMGGEPDG